MPAVAYRILRYMDACQKRGVGPDKGQAREAAGVAEPYFAAVLKSLSESGRVSGVSVEDYIDGTSGVVFRGARITMDGAEYLCENGTMAKARALMGVGFEAAVSTFVAALAKAAGLA